MGYNLYLSVECGGHFEVLKQSEIMSVYASGSYCELQVQHQDKIILFLRLEEIEARLSLPSLIRIHKSAIVNIDYIEKFTVNTVYINDVAFYVGREYKEKLFNSLNVLGNMKISF